MVDLAIRLKRFISYFSREDAETRRVVDFIFLAQRRKGAKTRRFVDSKFLTQIREDAENANNST
jgi:hypothetical protein